MIRSANFILRKSQLALSRPKTFQKRFSLSCLQEEEEEERSTKSPLKAGCKDTASGQGRDVPWANTTPHIYKEKGSLTWHEEEEEG